MAVPRMLPQTAPRSRQPRPASARANGSGLSLKAALSIWDPLNPTPIPTAVSDGHAHANTGMDRKSFTLLQSERAMLLISNTGTSGMVGALVQWTPNSTTLTWSNLVLPTLASNGHAGGGPTSGRAMKASVSILNSTTTRKIGGTVLTLNATSRIVWPASTFSDLSVAQADDVFAQIENQAQTRLQTGDHFRTTKGMRCHPCNDVEYTAFRAFHTATAGDLLNPATLTVGAPVTQADYALADINRFLETVSTCAPVTGSNGVTRIQEPRPMSTICVLFDRPPEPQTYTISARGTYYTRWPMESVMGQHHPPIPTAPPGLLSKLRDAGEHFKDVVHDVGDGIASVGQGIANAIPGVSQAYNMYSTFSNYQRAQMGPLALADIPIID